MLDDAHLIGYTDGVVAIIVAQNVEETKRKIYQMIIRTKSWLEDKALKLRTEKTELI